MQNPLETTLSGLAALLIVGTALTSLVVIPPAHSAAAPADIALAVPTLA